MPCGVSLLLEGPAARQVLALWRRFAAAGFATPGDLGVGPHVTLHVAAALDRAVAAERLDRWCASTPALPVRFDSLGLFPGTGVLFLAPVPTAPLLDRQADLHGRLADCSDGHDDHFRPGAWVPHCTIAMSLDSVALDRAVRLAAVDWSPAEGRLTAVELVRFPPLERWYFRRLP